MEAVLINIINYIYILGVKAKGKYLLCRPLFKVTNCDPKEPCSSFVISNIKSEGNQSILRLTACFKAFVSTP